MADAPLPPELPAPSPVAPAPAPQAPAPSPIAVPVPTPESVAPVPSPVAAPVPTPETPAPTPAEAAPEAPVPAPEDPKTLLETLGREEPKPDAPKPESDATKVEAAPEAPTPVVEPIEWKLEIPPTLKVDEPVLKEFTGALDQIVAPKDPADRAAAGQKLLAMHEKAMQDYAVQVTKNQFDVFNETKTKWLNDSMADPEIGGARWNTSLEEMSRGRDAVISAAKPGTDQWKQDVAEFDMFCKITGAGNHPVFHKILSRFDRMMSRPTLPPPNPSPPPDIGKNPTPTRSIYSRTDS